MHKLIVFLLQLYGSEKLDVIKTYLTDRPVNSAAISPLRDHVSIYTIIANNTIMALHVPTVIGGAWWRSRGYGGYHDYHEGWEI